MLINIILCIINKSSPRPYNLLTFLTRSPLHFYYSETSAMNVEPGGEEVATCSDDLSKLAHSLCSYTTTT